MRIKSCLGVFIFSLCLRLSAAVYYVHPNGNDGNNGLSVNLAWKTIGKVNQQTFKGNDSILFSGGYSFSGSLYFPPQSTGSVSKPIYIGSYGFGRAKILGGDSYGLYAYNNEGFYINNIDFEGSGYSQNNDFGVVFYTDIPNNRRLYNIQISEVYISGFRKGGVSLFSYPTDGSRTGYSDIKLFKVEAAYNGLVGITLGGNFVTTDTFYNHSNVEITYCKAHHNDGISGTGSHTGNGILIGQTDNCRVFRCEAWENGKNNDNPGSGPAGIWTWDSKHVIIEYCYSHHNRTKTVDGDGFDLDGGVRNSILQYNYSHDNDGPGLLIAEFSGARKMDNNIVRYNISENDGRGLGMLIWNGNVSGSGTIDKIDVYNNTIIIDTIGNPFANAAFAVYTDKTMTKNIRVCNNIILARNGANLIDIDPCGNLKFYNNVYFDFGQGYRFRDNKTVYTSLNNWRSATGQEKIAMKNVGFALDPQVIKPGFAGSISSADSLNTLQEYRCAFGSRIIGRGIKMDTLMGFQNVITDFFGDTVDFKQQYTPGVQEYIFPKPLFALENQCMNTKVILKNESKNALKVLWKFGNGNTSTDFQPNYSYSQPGNYSVKLIVFGKYGFSDSISRTIQIFKRPESKIFALNGCQGDTIVIKSESLNASTLNWFIDGVSADTAQKWYFPSTQSGSFKVTLLASQQNLCFDSANLTVHVFEKPDALFSLDSVCLGDSIRIVNLSSTKHSYHWVFDGLDTLTNVNSFKYGFTNSGIHTVSLLLRSENGCVSEKTQITKVYELPNARFNVENVCLMESIECAPNQYFGTHTWYFTTEDSSSEIQPNFVYSQSGKYSIIHRLIDSNNCRSLFQKEVEVFTLPSAQFSVEDLGTFLRCIPLDSTNDMYEWKVRNETYFKRILDLPILGDTQYSIHLKTTKENCDSSFNLTFTRKNLAILGSVSNNVVRIFPNPMCKGSVLNIEHLQAGQTLKIALYSFDGRQYKFKTYPTNEISNKQIILPVDWYDKNGLYLLEIQTNTQHYAQKVEIKQE